MSDLLQWTPQGLWCPAGGFHIDPLRAVEKAVITHGHADHARTGHAHYLTPSPGVGILKSRLGTGISVQGLDYGEILRIGEVQLSFHPSGHVLGAGQVRLEHSGEVWVVTGDYKLQDDGISGAFESVRCHTFLTESTFGLPVYRWPDPGQVMRDIEDWWRTNQSEGRASVLYTYSLGKAQRLLAHLDSSIGSIYVHEAVAKMNEAYRDQGIRLPECRKLSARETAPKEGPLVVTPLATEDSNWLSRFGPRSSALVSGWMRVRGTRRRGNHDRGFVMSDHADWPGLLSAVESTGAHRVLVTHGYADTLARFLSTRGLEASVLGGRSRPEEVE